MWLCVWVSACVCACLHGCVHECVWQSGRDLTYVFPPGKGGRRSGGEDSLTGRRLIAVILLLLRELISVTVLQHHDIVKMLSPTALVDVKCKHCTAADMSQTSVGALSDASLY